MSYYYTFSYSSSVHKNVFSSVLLAGAALKGCHADGAVAAVLSSASWTTLSLSGPCLFCTGGETVVNAVL
jgi:hypothetical protein